MFIHRWQHLCFSETHWILQAKLAECKPSKNAGLCRPPEEPSRNKETEHRVERWETEEWRFPCIPRCNSGLNTRIECPPCYKGQGKGSNTPRKLNNVCRIIPGTLKPTPLTTLYTLAGSPTTHPERDPGYDWDTQTRARPKAPTLRAYREKGRLKSTLVNFSYLLRPRPRNGFNIDLAGGENGIKSQPTPTTQDKSPLKGSLVEQNFQGKTG